ncbi:MAG: divalent-cation tolerance protein CutA [Parachlamydia sp.]|jgi:periplasmic divalent cation tolerance protein|nr:MAG: divalent-cation tolerance protein CutA [Parachlamydia sp.]
MTTFIEVYWTSGSLEEARKISRYLVQERLVACAQIIPWIESVYMWNNQLETAQESKITLKTQLANFEKIKEIILQNCSYQVPEITYVTLDGGNKEYLEWLETSTPNFSSTYIKESI